MVAEIYPQPDAYLAIITLNTVVTRLLVISKTDEGALDEEKSDKNLRDDTRFDSRESSNAK